MVAYQAGYLDQYLGQAPRSRISIDKDEKDFQVVSSHDEEDIVNKMTPSVEFPEQKVAVDLDPQPQTSSETQGEDQSNSEDKSLGESATPVPEKALPEYSTSSLPSADHSADASVSAKGNIEKVESETATIPNKEFQDTPLDARSDGSLGEKETTSVTSPTTLETPQVPVFLPPIIFLLIIVSWSYRCYEILKNNRFYLFGIMPVQAIILVFKGNQMHFNMS